MPAAPHDHDGLIARLGVCPPCLTAAGENAATLDDEQQLDAGEVACKLCDKPVDTRDARTWHVESGWVRRRFSGGGTHALSLRKVHPLWAHHECVDKARRGMIEQPPLDLGLG